MKYTTEIRQAQFDKDGLATVSGWATVYICDPYTREYVRASLDNVPLGGSVVADAYLDKPELPTKENIAIVRSADEKSWLHVTDYRGKTAYSTENRQAIDIDFIGDLPITLTLLEPKTEFDVWNGKKWVTDTEAQKAMLVEQAESEKSQRLEDAEQNILMLERKVRLGMATDEEIELLRQWEIYSVKVSEIDTSTVPDIEWPVKP
ncbi:MULTISPECIES: tail fiber assembly protein [unclassified Providencia]|uniref:tail fiber assembly protein n=1 Tax=unclassified Providencia TaxID=2633465 RepID=UPI0013E0556C|nr:MULTISPECIES: tail fiber assembly protein [unclassified Providencia]QIF59039.1 tail fiber assembly protein [Providencia sp. 1701011]QIF63057.1 tail fiber assembly protein [Providencia sp. 1701091]